MTTWYKLKEPAQQVKQFWIEVEESWDKLIALCSSYHPYYRKTHDLPITATKAEIVCLGERERIANNTPKDPLEEMDDAKEYKNIDLLQELCNQIWFGMPESSEVRYEPGFGILCDICSDAPTEDEE